MCISLTPDCCVSRTLRLVVQQDSGVFCRGTALLADQHGLAVHLDGARLFNACIATGSNAADYGRFCDTVSICLSKGLGAPVGSVLVGSEDFIATPPDAGARWSVVVCARRASLLPADFMRCAIRSIDWCRRSSARAEQIADAAEQRFPGRVRQQTNMVFVDITADELSSLTRRVRCRRPDPYSRATLGDPPGCFRCLTLSGWPIFSERLISSDQADQ